MDYNSNSNRYYDEEAERTIIKSMLFNNDCIKGVMERVDCEDFYGDHNREIIETIVSLHADKKEVNLKTLLKEMMTRGIWDEDAECFLEHIIPSISVSDNVLLCCIVVKGYAVMRRLMQLEDSIACLISEPDKAQEKIQLTDQMCRTVLAYDPKDGFLPVRELTGEVFNEIVDCSAGNEESEGLSTGYSCIDRNTGGLHSKEITIVGARPAMGKTSLGLNIARNVACNSGKTVAVFSADHTRDQIVSRLLSMESLVDANRTLYGQLSDEEWGRLALSVSSLNKLDIRINDNESLSVEDIASQCSRMDNLGLVIIDYLQLLEKASVGGKKERKRKCSKISKKLKNMAVLLDVPVVVLSQLSRECEMRNYKIPLLSDFDAYGTMTADADVVIGLYREVYYDPYTEYKNDAEAIILKNTHGWVGAVPLCWNSECLTFTDEEKE